MNNKENWYQTFFNGIATNFWQKAISPQYTQSEIEFIKRVTSLSASSTILDVPCGFGRHSIPFAQDGHAITAIDISEEYISHLQYQAKQEHLKITAVNADVLEYELQKSFDVVLCLGNSFNYFSYDKMKTFIRKIYNCLKQEGYFIINTGVLAESIFPNLKDRNWIQIDDILYLNENIYHAKESVLQTNYQFIQNEITESKTAWHFVYTLAEIIRLLTAAGFKTIEVYSDVELHPYKLGDRQAYFVARK